MKNKGKKGFFFSMDALIALFLIVSVLYIVPNTYISEKASYSEVQQDIITVLSNLKIDEVNSSYVKSMINSGKINKTNVSVIEQISDFWVSGNTGDAINLTKEMFIPLNESDNAGLWIDDDLIYSMNKTSFEDSDEVFNAQELLSGVETGRTTRGFSAHALLIKNEKTKVKYFGGYVGDGNLSINFKLEDYNEINSAYLEVAINDEFNFVINGNSLGVFTKSQSSSLVPEKYNIINLNYFKQGLNSISFKSNRINTSLFIAGGYFKISFKPKEVEYTYPIKYEFPGIDGIVNLYDSFYIPAQIQQISANLHYFSDYTTYLNIGNVTVFEKNSTGEENITLINSDFSSKLNYSAISRKTVPLRMGMEEVEAVVGKRGNADVVLITDLSDSMEWELNSESEGVARTNCSDSSIYSSDTKRVSLAKCLDKEFIDTILGVSGNRVALSAFYGDTGTPYKGRVYEEGLSGNATYLKSKVEIYSPKGGTCICCSINDAYKILSEQSNSSRDRYIILMTDGIPTHTCQAASGCEGTRTGLPSDEGLWLGWGAGCYGGFDDCVGTDCQCAMHNANWSSCRANYNLNATVHSIGFGPVTSCTNANATLQSIAKCGKGNYYASSNATQLKTIYEDIAKDILNLSFIKQTALVVGNFSSKLYNDSYISFTYNIPSQPFGNIVTVESQRLNDWQEINFSVPANSTVLEASAVSYSGAYWTKTVKLSSGAVIYNLTDYGISYVKLGDPYQVQIPLGYIATGNNSIRIDIGATSENSTNASSEDKVIYTLLLPFQEGFSNIMPSASGCIWQIDFEDGSRMQLPAPSNYAGTDICNLTSYKENDAIDIAVYNLLKQLDFNGNKKIDAKFSQNELSIETITVSGVPFMWFSTAEARSWK